VRATAGQGSEADHEEMQTREGHHVNCQLAEIRVELAGEAQASSNTRHDSGDEVVQVTVRWVVQLECAHANVVKGFVVNAEGLVRVLDQLMDGEGGVVGLNDGVGDLWRWDDGEGSHHAVWELLADLGDEESSHTSTGTTTERVGDLETLKAVAAFGLTTDDIENLVNKFGTFSIMTLGPVISSARLAEDEVIGAEELTERTSTDGVHGAWFEIDEDGAGHKLVAGGLEMRLKSERRVLASLFTSLK
jgi:hypothetical protein